MRRELVSLLAVLPLLAANWARPFHELVFASDACPSAWRGGRWWLHALHEAPWLVSPRGPLARLPGKPPVGRQFASVMVADRAYINVLELRIRMALDVLHVPCGSAATGFQGLRVDGQPGSTGHRAQGSLVVGGS